MDGLANQRAQFLRDQFQVRPDHLHKLSATSLFSLQVFLCRHLCSFDKLSRDEEFVLVTRAYTRGSCCSLYLAVYTPNGHHYPWIM